MKFQTWMVFSVLAVRVFLPNALASGGYSGGGGDSVLGPFDQYAWFYGTKKPIQACLEIAPDFGLTREQIVPQLEQALAAWSDYISAKRLNIKYSLFGNRFTFTLAVSWLSACDGREDLKFYFGGNNTEITAAKKHYNDPVAMAELTRFDRQAAWGRGFVWVASEKSLNDSYPNWHNGKSLTTILLHEIGHVYGNSHVSGTIMTENIKDVLNWTGSGAKTSIDITRELYHCSGCSYEFKGYAFIGSPGPATDATKNLVERILGRTLSQSPQVTLSYDSLGSDFEGSGLYTLTFKDLDTQVDQKFEVKMTGIQTQNGPFVFSNNFQGWSTTQQTTHYGYLTTEKGERVPMVLSENLADSSGPEADAGTRMNVSGFVDGQYAGLLNYALEHWTSH